MLITVELKMFDENFVIFYMSIANVMLPGCVHDLVSGLSSQYFLHVNYSVLELVKEHFQE